MPTTTRPKTKTPTSATTPIKNSTSTTTPASTPPPLEALTPTQELNLASIPEDDPFRDILISLATDRDRAKDTADQAEAERKALDEQIMSILRDHYDAKKIEQIFPGYNLNWLTGTNVTISATKLAELGVEADIIAAAKVSKKYTYIQINSVKEKS